MEEMNETLQTLLSRRSVRAYKPDPIPEGKLKAILEAGLWAPSGMNMQSVRFVVLKAASEREKLLALAEDFPNRGGNPFYGAPVIVLVFADKTALTPVQDASLAIGNMANAAASLGIASCWVNCVKDIFKTPAGKNLKKAWLPDPKFVAVGSLALGYADETPEPKPREEGRIVYPE